MAGHGQAVMVNGDAAIGMGVGKVFPGPIKAEVFRCRQRLGKQPVEIVRAEIRVIEAGDDLTAGGDQVRQAAGQLGPVATRW